MCQIPEAYREQAMKTHLRSYGTIIFGVALDRKVEDGLLMFMLK